MNDTPLESPAPKRDMPRDTGTPSKDVATVQPSESEGNRERDDSEAIWAQCEELARTPRILDSFVEDLARSGFVGEDRAAKLLYAGEEGNAGSVKPGASEKKRAGKEQTRQASFHSPASAFLSFLRIIRCSRNAWIWSTYLLNSG